MTTERSAILISLDSSIISLENDINNPAHILCEDNKTHCIPILNMIGNGNIEMPWKWYGALNGYTIFNFIKWFFGVQATIEQWEIYNHFSLGERKVCHRWRNRVYKYHGS